MLDERKAKLRQVLPGPGGSFVYEYDFGDSWEHDILVEGVAHVVPRATLPSCDGGERACPPEDSGGLGGYYDMMEIRANRRHPEHREVMEWLGDHDPERFDLDAINRILADG